MTRQEAEEIILRTLKCCGADLAGKQLPLEFPVEVSARHVHLTEEAVEKLFGEGAALTPKRPLSQPGQFLSAERVSLVTAKGRIDNVAVLGPARPEIQTELAVTDCRKLGINAPLRISGDLKGAADCYIVGPAGMIHAEGSVIVAQAHIHITPAEAEPIGITDGQKVTVTIGGERPVTFENVICRVSDKAALAMHIDSDEANACCLSGSATAYMRAGGTCRTGERDCMSLESGLCSWEDPGKGAGASGDGRKQAEVTEIDPELKLITEETALRLAAGRSGSITLPAGVILTPSAKDVFLHAGLEVGFA